MCALQILIYSPEAVSSTALSQPGFQPHPSMTFRPTARLEACDTSNHRRRLLHSQGHTASEKQEGDSSLCITTGKTCPHQCMLLKHDTTLRLQIFCALSMVIMHCGTGPFPEKRRIFQSRTLTRWYLPVSTLMDQQQIFTEHKNEPVMYFWILLNQYFHGSPHTPRAMCSRPLGTM